jgi:hypothetical protein
MSWGRSLTPQEWREFRGIVSLGLVVTMPILMALPPRRFNGITLMQLGMLAWGADEQVEYRTGRDAISWAMGPKIVEASTPVKAAARVDEAPKAKAGTQTAKEEVKAVAANAAAKWSRGREG